MKTFHYEFRVSGEIEVDDVVFESALNDKWRAIFYPSIRTQEQLVEHLAFNIALNGSVLSGLDGFANLPDSAVNVIVHSVYEGDVELLEGTE